MAEAFARIYGAGSLEAYSAGSKPAGIINQKAIDVMHEIGYDLKRHNSKSLAEISDIEYDIVVTMGCGDECPLVRAKRHEDWNIPDPKGMPLVEFRAVRDLIENKVKGLLSRL